MCRCKSYQLPRWQRRTWAGLYTDLAVCVILLKWATIQDQMLKFETVFFCVCIVDDYLKYQVCFFLVCVCAVFNAATMIYFWNGVRPEHMTYLKDRKWKAKVCFVTFRDFQDSLYSCSLMSNNGLWHLTRYWILYFSHLASKMFFKLWSKWSYYHSRTLPGEVTNVNILLEHWI